MSDAGNKRLRRVSLTVKYPKPSPPPERWTLPPRVQLRKLMAAHSLKAHEVAYFVDLKPQTVRAYMCGSRAMPLGLIERIKRAVGDT